MDEHIHLSKIEAAKRQLDRAIRLLFNDCDPVAVHTLVGAASVIISDLVDKQHPDKSWDRFAQEANKITARFAQPRAHRGVERQVRFLVSLVSCRREGYSIFRSYPQSPGSNRDSSGLDCADDSAPYLG